MKKKYFLLPLLFLSVSFMAFMAVNYTIDSILQKLQLTGEDAKEYVWNDCSGCYFGYPMPGELKNTSMDERPLIVKAVGEFAKIYTKSDDFKRRYLEHRESSKPNPPQPPESMDEIKRKQKEELKKTIAEMEKSKSNIPASEKAEFEKAIEGLKADMAELDKSGDASDNSEMDQYMKQGYEAEMQDYKEKLQQWEKEYPKEPDMMIKRWLEEFLKVSSDVDFNAELSVDKLGKKRFVNSEYENKPDIWKLCFRSGKKTTEAARTFAEEWLKELK
ncbi:MAG TPA: hypothetical protein VHO03_07735 [Ignavibacteriales bacterium]|nr:hypothetical protein [Ignavibacteriales bacterium]